MKEYQFLQSFGTKVFSEVKVYILMNDHENILIYPASENFTTLEKS